MGCLYDGSMHWYLFNPHYVSSHGLFLRSCLSLRRGICNWLSFCSQSNVRIYRRARICCVHQKCSWLREEGWWWRTVENLFIHGISCIILLGLIPGGATDKEFAESNKIRVGESEGWEIDWRRIYLFYYLTIYVYRLY